MYIYIYIYKTEKKLLRTTNGTIFPAHINPLFGSACHTALGSANDSTKAGTPAVRRLSVILSLFDLGAVLIEHSA